MLPQCHIKPYSIKYSELVWCVLHLYSWASTLTTGPNFLMLGKGRPGNVIRAGGKILKHQPRRWISSYLAHLPSNLKLGAVRFLGAWKPNPKNQISRTTMHKCLKIPLKLQSFSKILALMRAWCFDFHVLVCWRRLYTGILRRFTNLPEIQVRILSFEAFLSS